MICRYILRLFTPQYGKTFKHVLNGYDILCLKRYCVACITEQNNNDNNVMKLYITRTQLLMGI